MATRARVTRREFLQKGLLGVLGAGLVSCSGPQRLLELTPAKPTATLKGGHFHALAPSRGDVLSKVG